MTDVEIGRGKTGRRAYSLSEIGIVPARRTRDPEEVRSPGRSMPTGSSCR